MQKKAQAMGVIVVVLLAVLVVGGGIVAWQQGLFQTVEERAIATRVTDTDCDIAPSVSVSGVDSLNTGTAVTNTGENGWVNGVYRPNSTTGLAKGDKLILLAEATNYINKVLPEATIDCGVNVITAKMDKLDGTVSLKVFNDEGNAVTNSADGGAINQSDSTDSITNKLTVTCPTDEVVNGGVITIEVSNTTEVDVIGLSSESATINSVGNPDIATIETGTGSYMESFHVSDFMDDGGVTTFYITFSPETGTNMGGAPQSVYINVYAEQPFVDTDGTLQVGVENSDGTLKHVDAADNSYDYSIGAL